MASSKGCVTSGYMVVVWLTYCVVHYRDSFVTYCCVLALPHYRGRNIITCRQTTRLLSDAPHTRTMVNCCATKGSHYEPAKRATRAGGLGFVLCRVIWWRRVMMMLVITMWREERWLFCGQSWWWRQHCGWQDVQNPVDDDSSSSDHNYTLKFSVNYFWW